MGLEPTWANGSILFREQLAYEKRCRVVILATVVHSLKFSEFFWLSKPVRILAEIQAFYLLISTPKKPFVELNKVSRGLSRLHNRSFGLLVESKKMSF